jgi:dihydrofolate reductase
MKLSAIAALDETYAISDSGSLPWGTIEADKQQYYEAIKDSVAIAGRKTAEGTTAKEKVRHLIVISSKDEKEIQINMPPESFTIVSSVSEAIDEAERICKAQETVFVIGGGTIYNQMFKYFDEMQLSHIDGTYGGDVHFPEFNKETWEVTDVDEYDEFTVKTYIRR